MLSLLIQKWGGTGTERLRRFCGLLGSWELESPRCFTFRHGRLPGTLPENPAVLTGRKLVVASIIGFESVRIIFEELSVEKIKPVDCQWTLGLLVAVREIAFFPEMSESLLGWTSEPLFPSPSWEGVLSRALLSSRGRLSRSELFTSWPSHVSCGTSAHHNPAPALPDPVSTIPFGRPWMKNWEITATQNPR